MVILHLKIDLSNVFSYGKGNRGELGLGRDILTVKNITKINLEQFKINNNLDVKNIFAGVRRSFILLSK